MSSKKIKLSHAFISFGVCLSMGLSQFSCSKKKETQIAPVSKKETSRMTAQEYYKSNFRKLMVSFDKFNRKVLFDMSRKVGTRDAFVLLSNFEITQMSIVNEENAIGLLMDQSAWLQQYMTDHPDEFSSGYDDMEAPNMNDFVDEDLENVVQNNVEEEIEDIAADSFEQLFSGDAEQIAAQVGEYVAEEVGEEVVNEGYQVAQQVVQEVLEIVGDEVLECLAGLFGARHALLPLATKAVIGNKDEAKFFAQHRYNYCRKELTPWFDLNHENIETFMRHFWGYPLIVYNSGKLSTFIEQDPQKAIKLPLTARIQNNAIVFERVTNGGVFNNYSDYIWTNFGVCRPVVLKLSEKSKEIRLPVYAAYPLEISLDKLAFGNYNITMDWDTQMATNPGKTETTGAKQVIKFSKTPQNRSDYGVLVYEKKQNNDKYVLVQQASNKSYVVSKNSDVRFVFADITQKNEAGKILARAIGSSLFDASLFVPKMDFGTVLEQNATGVIDVNLNKLIDFDKRRDNLYVANIQLYLMSKYNNPKYIDPMNFAKLMNALFSYNVSLNNGSLSGLQASVDYTFEQ
jgi:hypothetical protein